MKNQLEFLIDQANGHKKIKKIGGKPFLSVPFVVA